MQQVSRMVAVIVWILLSFGITGMCFSAGAGAWITNPSNGHRYKSIDCGSWTDCENMAVTEGAHLVTIRNQQEQDWLTQNFGTSQNYWIGFTDQDQEDNWTWISGEPVTYTNWAYGEPNNSYTCGEHWAVMNWQSSAWNDLGTCTEEHSGLAIIEKIGIEKPALAFDVLSRGLYLWDGKWDKISNYHPNLLSAWGNLLVANFPSLGLFLHNGTSWDRIAWVTTAESVVGIGGYLYMDTGSAIYRYNGSWSRIHYASPALMASRGSRLVADFPGLGIWEYNGYGWELLSTPIQAEQMLGIEEKLFVDFGPSGLYYYDGDWRSISPANPQRMHAFGASLVVSFDSEDRTGLYLYENDSLKRISTNPLAEGFASTASALFVDRGDKGLYKYENNAWQRISSLNPESIVIYDNKLVGDFGAKGVKIYSDTGWSRLINRTDVGMMQGVVFFE